MKSAQYNTYGGPEVIHIVETSTPAPKEGQIVVEVHAASINAFDWKLRSGYMQKMIPLTLPITIGGDFAGKVTEVGGGVEGFKVGDEVYGQAIVLNGGSGSFAQLVAANTKYSALKPKTITFEAAAALPLTGVSALQALEDHIKLQKGQKILIHGGAGGIGHIAIQLAKAIGAYVITTASMMDMNFLKELGADEVIDYKEQKFEDIVKDVDAVFDLVGGETTNKSFTVLKKGGVLVSMLGEPNQEMAKKYEITAIGQQTHTDTSHLTRLAALVDGGKIKVNVDKAFPLEQIQEAFTYQEKVHPKGKVVIKIA